MREDWDVTSYAEVQTNTVRELKFQIKEYEKQIEELNVQWRQS